MDSDLAESVGALKEIFARRGIQASFGKADPAVVEDLRKTLRVPARFRAFLQAADPVDVESVTPTAGMAFSLASATTLSTLFAPSVSE